MAVIVSGNCEPPLSVTAGCVAFWKLAVLTIILVSLIREKAEVRIVIYCGWCRGKVYDGIFK
jgi:hypothetical protein